MLWNYYIDKCKNDKNDDHVDIKLEYPLEVSNYDYFKIKLCSFTR